MHHERYNMVVAKYALSIMYSGLVGLVILMWQATSATSWAWIIALAGLIGACVGAVFGAGVVWGGIKRDVANFGRMASEARDDLKSLPLLNAEIEHLQEWKRSTEIGFQERRKGRRFESH